jgi:predicted RNA-binding protein with PUA-like domain
VVGIAEVVREAYQDPTTQEDWSSVDIKPVRALKRPVSLAEVKARKDLANMALIRLGRLSVQPVTPAEWKAIMEMAGEKAK